MLLYIIIILLIVLLIAGTAVAVMINQENDRRNRVMNVVQGSASGASKTRGKAAEQDQRRADLAKKLKESGEEGQEKKGNLNELIMQAGLDISVQKFWMSSIMFAVLATFGVKLMGMSTLVTIFVAVTALFGLPKLFLKIKAKKRQKKFLQDFPDALESMVRLLKAGMPVSEAIAMEMLEFYRSISHEQISFTDIWPDCSKLR